MSPPPAASNPHRPTPVPTHLSPAQQQQLKDLFQEFSDIVSQEEDDLGCTPLLQHTIETEGPHLRQPYRRQNPAVRQEEMAQVQQMLSNGVIRPSNSPWASLVVMVKKRDGSLRFCVDFRQLKAAAIKDAHPIPRIDDLPDALQWAHWLPLLISRADTGRSLSRSGTRRRRHSVPAAASCLSSTRSPLASATLPPPSPASWIVSSPVSTGKRASFI